MPDNLDVFINCPFDPKYRTAFEAILFAIAASGFKPRCALEESDSGEIRYEKLCKLIKQSQRSIHDLSFTGLGVNGLPRFNMPFELGLAMGAKQFGGKPHRNKRLLIMVEKPYTMAAYISDLGGNDPAPHQNDPKKVMQIVRKYLSQTPQGKPLIGLQKLTSMFEKFKSDLPELAAEHHLEDEEIDAFDEYPTYLWFQTEFLKTVQQGR